MGAPPARTPGRLEGAAAKQRTLANSVQTYVNWVNKKLASRKIEIKKITEADGVVLINLLEVLSGRPVGQRYNTSVRTIVHAQDNAKIALDFANRLKAPVHSFTAQHIVEKNEKHITGFVHGLVIKYTMLSVNQVGDVRPALLEWLKPITAKIGLAVTELKRDMADGLGFLAVFEAHMKGTLEWERLRSQSLTDRFRELRLLWANQGHDFALTPRSIADKGEEVIINELQRERQLVQDERAQVTAARQALLGWGQTMARGCEVTDLSKSWLDGTAFLAVLEAQFPGTVAPETYATPAEAFRAARDGWATVGHTMLIDEAVLVDADERSVELELGELFVFCERKRAQAKKREKRETLIRTELVKGIRRAILEFRIDYYTHFDEVMYVYGELPELGAWDKDKAVQMEFVNADAWKAEVDVPLLGGTGAFKYKYFVRNERTGGVNEEADDSHVQQLQDVVQDGFIVVDDQWHERGMLDDYNRSIDWGNIRQCKPVSGPTITNLPAPGTNVQFFVVCYAPSVKQDQTLKLVLGAGTEVSPADPALTFPLWHFSFTAPTVAVTYQFKAVLPDGREFVEEVVRSPRLAEIPAHVTTIATDHWIVKPFGG